MVVYVISEQSVDKKGHSSDLWMVSIIVYSCIILMVTFKLAIHSRYWSALLIITILFFSLIPYLAYMWISNYKFSPHIIGTVKMLFETAKGYFVILLTCCFMLFFESAIIFVQFLRNGLVSKMQKVMRSEDLITSEYLSIL
jgi:hypothetical protein